MLIALSGGTSVERSKVAEILVSESRGSLLSHAQVEPVLPGRKPRPTASVIARVAGRRAALLSELLNGRTRRSGLILTHCLTEPEAELIRAQGGHIWHIYGEPSHYVAIRRGEPFVSVLKDAPSHVVDPLEAYSQVALARRRAMRPGVQRV